MPVMRAGKEMPGSAVKLCMIFDPEDEFMLGEAEIPYAIVVSVKLQEGQHNGECT